MKTMSFDSQYEALMYLTSRYENDLVDDFLYYTITQFVNQQGHLPMLGIDDGNIVYDYPDDKTLESYVNKFVTTKNILH